MNNPFHYIPPEIYSLLLFVLSFALCFLMVPRLITVVKFKKIMDDPNKRSSHLLQTPTLGGVAFFVSLIMSIFFMQWHDAEAMSMRLIAGLTILFFVGLKDDLMVIAPRTKIISQLLAIAFVLFNSNLIPLNFHGFLGIHLLPYWLGTGLAFFIVIAITNAYNLIDGIDGLASMTGIVILLAFALLFFEVKLYFYAFLAVVAIGFLLAFLRYNLSHEQKIFMGDTGSMIVGYVLGILTLRFLTLDALQLEQIFVLPENTIILTLALIFILFVDTLRVMAIRLINKKGLFTPDRNHIHHILVNLGMSHVQVSLIVSLYSCFIILFFFWLNLFLNIWWLGLAFVAVALFTVLVLFHLNANYAALKQKLRFKELILQKTDLKLRTTIAGFLRLFF